MLVLAILIIYTWLSFEIKYDFNDFMVKRLSSNKPLSSN